MDRLTNTADFNNALAACLKNADLDALARLAYVSGEPEHRANHAPVVSAEERVAQLALIQAVHNAIDTQIHGKVVASPKPSSANPGGRRSCGECGDPMTRVAGHPGWRCDSAHCC